MPRIRTSRSLRVAAAVVGLVGVASAAQAAVPAIDDAAEVGQAAERVEFVADRLDPDTPLGVGLMFPIEATPVCEVLNNFGGYSKAAGSTGHQGVDIGAELGQEVYAVEDGVLYRQFDSSASGNGWGLWADSDTKYRYYHLDRYADGLAVGDRVAAGQLIGYVGDTGNATPGGWHLHFEVRPGPAPHDTPVDPVPLLAIPSVCNVY